MLSHLVNRAKMVYQLLLTALLLVHLTVSSAEKLISPVPKATRYQRLGDVNLGAVNTIMQTTNGYIWLCTNEGLIRFDGYDALQLTHNIDAPHSISHNMVMGAVEDNEGNLWVATHGGGLNKFTVQTGQFKRIDLRVNPTDPPPSELLYFLTIDDNNHLWIGSVDGLMRLDINSEKALALPSGFAPLVTTMTDRLFIDSNKHWWFTTYRKGVFWYDHKTLRHFDHDPDDPNSLSANNARNITEDAQGNIWIATNEGLNRFNRDSLGFSRFLPSNQSDFSAHYNDITALQFDHKGTLWIAPTAYGVSTFSAKTGRFAHVTGQHDINNVFVRNSVADIFSDKDGTLWFGSNDGLVLLPPKSLNFQYLSNDSGTLRVTALQPLAAGQIALVGNFQFYQFDLSGFSANHRFGEYERVYNLALDGNNDLWLGTIGQGLAHLQPTTDKLHNYPDSPIASSTLRLMAFFGLFEDNMRRLWVSPFAHPPGLSGGLYQFDRQKDHYELFYDSAYPIVDVLQLSDNTLLLATNIDGLVSLNVENKNVEDWSDKYANTPKRPVTMILDSQQRLWVGTRGHGLARFDPDSQQFEYYTTNSGLLSNNIRSIVEDDNHDIWLGTPVGLTRLSPSSSKTLNIEAQDGLLFSHFYKRAAFKADDGTLFMGTNKGLVFFDPNDIKADFSQGNVVINDFKLFNQAVPLRHLSPNSPLIKPIEYTDKVTLFHHHYLFSFGFAATDFVRPDLRQFAYKMDGLDNQWIHTDANNRIATYTTLPAGDYVFKVKTSLRDGSWDKNYSSVNVTIVPPWWASNTAYALYVVLVIALVWLWTYARTKQLHHDAVKLKEGIKQRTAQLKQRTDTISELLDDKDQLLADKNRLLSDKDKLLSNVSHEFRTPLTLLLNPVQSWLDEKPDEQTGRKLSMIQRNAKRLLRLVEQLLTLSKLDIGSQESQQVYSLAAVLNPLLVSFEPLLSEKNIQLTVAPFDDIQFEMTNDALELILINLISNAIKYNSKKGNIEITASRDDTQATITITDDGIGISAADQTLVFERFGRADSPYSPDTPGTGIGLALVKELVEANQGQITLSSEVNCGSTFAITLPLAAPQTSKTATETNQSHHTRLEIDVVQSAQTHMAVPVQQETNHSQSVLLIDDNPDMLSLLQDTLSPFYQCLLANNGEDGLAQALMHIPDIIICDVMMPGINGYEVAKKLKDQELCCHIPLILLTAKGDVDSKMSGWQQDIDEYMVKPFAKDELLIRVANLLSIRQLLKKRFHAQLNDQSAQPAGTDGLTDKDRLFIEKVDTVLSEHFHDPQFNRKQMAQLLLVSERQLHRKLDALFDQNFTDHLRKYRLKQSTGLMNSGLQISEICEKTGFSSPSYFAKYFKAEFGLTPKQYQSHHNK